MDESKEIYKIKKMYGEKFMQLCRSLFPTILEQEGRLLEILTSTFATNGKSLYEDIVGEGLEESFKNFIYSKIDVETPENERIIERTPYELLEEAGYELIECLTEEDIQEFRKYYRPSEELCTFRGGRLDRCIVFFAVKKNVEDIKRENFERPRREDEYGTSVMGIQFNRKGICTVSIKNRYNHAVNNPDATYGNDLDRIIPGLERSFSTLLREQYGLELNSTNVEQFEIPGYVIANDGKYYKYNMEIVGDYYCPGNIIIRRGEATEIARPEEGLLVDYFYIDKKNKRIRVCPCMVDSFTDGLRDIKKIEVVKSEDANIHRIIKIYLPNVEEPVIIGIDKNNQIVKYENKNITEIGDDFLYANRGLTQLSLPSLIQAGTFFLHANEGLTELELPSLTQVGACFLSSNKGLRKLELPNLIIAGNWFIDTNEGLTELKLPNLKVAGNCFLYANEGLTELKLPNLEIAGNCFLYANEGLTELELPNLTEVGYHFLDSNNGLVQLELPKLPEMKEKFSDIIARNIEARRINAQSIAQLDRDTELTSSEVSEARKTIDNLKDERITGKNEK